jgi:hypothetical protein
MTSSLESGANKPGYYLDAPEYANFSSIKLSHNIVSEEGSIRDLQDGEMKFLRNDSVSVFRYRQETDLAFALHRANTIPEQNELGNHIGVMRVKEIGVRGLNGYFVDCRYMDVPHVVPTAETGMYPKSIAEFDPVPVLGLAYLDREADEDVIKYAPGSDVYGERFSDLMNMVHARHGDYERVQKIRQSR